MNRQTAKKLSALSYHLVSEGKVPKSVTRKEVYNRLKREYKKGKLKLTS